MHASYVMPGIGPGPFMLPRKPSASGLAWKETPTACQFGISEWTSTVSTVAAQSINGMYAVINGVVRRIPINPSPRHTDVGLPPNLTLFAYLEDKDGATKDVPENVRLVLHPHTPIADSYNAISVDNTDHRRTLVGMARTNSAGRFEITLQRQLCCSWNNPRLPNQCMGELAADTVMTSAGKTGFTIVDSAARAEFLTWGYGQMAHVLGSVKGDTAGMQLQWGVMLDAWKPVAERVLLKTAKMTLTTANAWMPLAHSAPFFTTFSPLPNDPNDGYHTLDLVAWPVGGSVTFAAGSGVATLVDQ